MMRSILKSCIFIFTAFTISCLSIHSAYCAGTFISAPNRVDMVHDPGRNLLYITSGTDVLRYSLDAKEFLTPFQLGGDLLGIDLSPDANTLAVADGSGLGIYLIDLQTGSSRKVSFTGTAYDERSTFSVAFGNDGNILVAAGFQWVPLRKYNPVTGEVTTLLESIRGSTMLSASADGNIIGFSDVPCLYRVVEGDIVEKTRCVNATSSFDIGTNRNGTQFAIPGYDGANIYDSDLVRITTLGRYDGPRPIGVVYAPSEDIVYFAWTETQEVRAYEATHFAEVKSYNFECTFQYPTNSWPYQQARLKISRDGALLFATVDGGIRYVRTETDFTPTHALRVHTTGAGTGFVTSSPDGIHCPSVCTQDYTSGRQVTLTASAHRGSVFSGWSGAGCAGTGTCTVDIDAEKTVTATFSRGDDLGRSIFIPSPLRVDMVHDPGRNILYITSGTDILRYSLDTRQFLASFRLGGNLKGIDLSPDANTLAVADDTIVGMHLIDLQAGSSRKVFFPRTPFTGGSYTVAYGNDGNIVVSGSGPVRKYDTLTGEVTELTEAFGGNTTLGSSADGNIIGFANDYMTFGRWGRYRVSDGSVVGRTDYNNGTGWYNFEIGVNHNGTQFVLLTEMGTYIYDSDFARIATFGQFGGPQPVGAVYDPSKEVVYFTWAQTREVRAFETTHFTQVNSYNFEYSFPHNGNKPYQPGRLKISRDGSLLFVTVEGGIRYIETHPRGDVDRDGAVDLADAIAALRVAAGIAAASEPVSIKADVDGDRRIGTAEAAYDLQVVSGLRNNNRKPVLTVSGDRTRYKGKEINLTVSATDQDNDPLTLSATSLPAHASFTPDTGIFYWSTSQPGTYPVTFTVRDDFGGETSETVNLVVNEYPPFTASDYYPLNVGDWIDYELNGPSTTIRIATTGTKVIGNAVAKISSYLGVLDNYFTSDGNGVQYYGQYSVQHGVEALFSPPLLVIPENMAPGTSHDSVSYWIYYLSGNPYHIRMTVHTEYVTLGDVRAVNEILPDCIEISTRLDQYVIETGQSLTDETTYDWYCKGVGLVKEVSGSNTFVIKQSNVGGIIRNY